MAARTLRGIADPASTPWAQLTVLTDDEVGTQLIVKAALGGDRPNTSANAQ